MTRRILILLFLLIPAILSSQNTNPGGEKRAVAVKKPSASATVQARFSDQFRIKNVYFNRRIDYSGRGEILEIEMLIENLTDDPFELYIFTIASYEIIQKERNSFKRPVPPEKRTKNFVVFPDDIENFKTPYKDKDGKIKKDVWGKDMYLYQKFPHDYMKGINPASGKTYTVKDKLVIRTYHLSPYRTNFYFFNEAAIIAYDKKGTPVYRQLYRLDGWRR